MRGKSVITVANERVSILVVLRMLGVDVPEDVSGRSMKTSCPFGLFHSDGGVSPAMRIYPDTNSVYCFSCGAAYDPVSLAAKAMDVNVTTAANRLLDHVGYRPLNLAHAWRNAASFEPEPDKSLMASALKTYCRRITPDWNRRQFDPAVAASLTRCLSVLDLVRTSRDVTLWLNRCKAVMTHAIQAAEPSVRQADPVELEVPPTKGEP